MIRILICGLASLCATGVASGGNRSPVSVTEIQGESQVTAEAAAREAARVIGSAGFDAAEPRFVRYQDRAALGLAAEGSGWLVRGNVTLVSREPVAVNAIIDARTGEFAFAFTDSTGEWPAAMDNEADLSRMLKEAGWDLGSETPDSMRSTMAEVMENATHSQGADPTDVGQMIIRPRWNSPRFPARKEGERLIPIRPTAKVWIIQVCGRKQQHPAPPRQNGTAPPDFYSTEEFFQLKDDSLEFWGRFYLP